MSSSGHRARQNAANAIDREAVGNGKGNGMSGGPKRENLEDIQLVLLVIFQRNHKYIDN